MRFTVRRRDQRQGIDIVVTKTACEEGRAVQIESVAPHLEFAQAEAFIPAMKGCFPIQQGDLGHIQDRRLGGPALRPGQRHFTGEVGAAGFVQGDSLVQGSHDCTVSGFHLNVHRRICRGAFAPASQTDVYQCGRFVQVAAHPHIVYPHGRRGFQFDIPVKASEAMISVHASLAAGRVIAHRGDQLRRFARRHQIGNVILVGAAIGIQMSDALFVHPEPRLGAHAPYFQPDAFPLPVGRDIHGTAVPRGSHIQVIDRTGNAVEERIPRLAHAGFADPLRLPAARYGNSPADAPVGFVPAGALTHAVPPHQPGIGDKLPLTT
ncbi:MAG: hypothetical protein BWY09_02369 [Candidatus Hydrogenedentes bacterium ADurb.Bin179]|nr:MAG: hypothetical protein BWY09_02369 [Candidatus Hydrogenedentes bacterium ADurb.Bin179]